ncbi:MAG: hypothetical protein MHM6MM_003467 [Cercozoa sp. M6MM]
MPLKALILVGGFGTRLRPLTFSVPKPMVPLANMPIVEHQVKALVAIGVKHVVLAVGYQSEAMAEFASGLSEKYGVDVTISLEDTPLGTAGPLALAKEILAADESPFFVLNSDVICDFPLANMLQFHRSHSGSGTILVTTVKEPSKYGVVVADSDGQIECFVEKPKEWVGDKINAGLYILDPCVLERIEERPMSIEREVFPQMAADEQLFRFVLPSFWMDIGQPHDYLKGQRLFLSSQGEKRLVHPTAKVPESACLGDNVVIGPNVVVGDNVRLRNCAIFEGSKVGAGALIDNAIVGWKCQVGRWARLTDLVVLGKSVKVAEEVLLRNTRIAPHKTIKQNEFDEAPLQRRDIM